MFNLEIKNQEGKVEVATATSQVKARLMVTQLLDNVNVKSVTIISPENKVQAIIIN